MKVKNFISTSIVFVYIILFKQNSSIIWYTNTSLFNLIIYSVIAFNKKDEKDLLCVTTFIITIFLSATKFLKLILLN